MRLPVSELTYLYLAPRSNLSPFDKGIHLVIALVLGNICEYLHKLYTAENYRFFGLHFSRRQCGSRYRQQFDV